MVPVEHVQDQGVGLGPGTPDPEVDQNLDLDQSQDQDLGQSLVMLSGPGPGQDPGPDPGQGPGPGHGIETVDQGLAHARGPKSQKINRKIMVNAEVDQEVDQGQGVPMKKMKIAICVHDRLHHGGRVAHDRELPWRMVTIDLRMTES